MVLSLEAKKSLFPDPEPEPKVVNEKTTTISQSLFLFLVPCDSTRAAASEQDGSGQSSGWKGFGMVVLYGCGLLLYEDGMLINAGVTSNVGKWKLVWTGCDREMETAG